MSCASRALFFLLAQFSSTVALSDYTLALSLSPILHRSLPHLSQFFPDQILRIVRLVCFARFVVHDIEQFFHLISKLRMSIQLLGYLFSPLFVCLELGHGKPRLRLDSGASAHRGATCYHSSWKACPNYGLSPAFNHTLSTSFLECQLALFLAW